MPPRALLPLALFVAGCTSAVPDAPTWHQHVAPIVVASCGGCHTDGGSGPFALDSYAAAAPMASWIASTTGTRQMPPWGAVDEDCAQTRPLHADPSLSEDQRQILANWASSGALEGDPSQAAPIPPPITQSLAAPTRRVLPEAPYTVRGSGDDFRCVVLDPAWTDTVWLTGLEIVPDATEVVHHALVWLDPTGASLANVDADGGYPCFGDGGFAGGQLIGVWVPGAGGIEYPEGAGLEAPAGARLVVQYHYFGDGTDTPDASALDLRWEGAQPERRVLMSLRGNARTAEEGLQPGDDDPTDAPAFLIPAGKPAHREVIRDVLPASLPEVALFLVGPHMHLTGVDMSVRVERAGGSGGPPQECLLRAGRYDFNWQRGYQYDVPLLELPRVAGGDTLVLQCNYDNSLDNENLRGALLDEGLEAPVDVGLGSGSLDEMCLAVLGVVY